MNKSIEYILDIKDVRGRNQVLYFDDSFDSTWFDRWHETVKEIIKKSPAE